MSDRPGGQPATIMSVPESASDHRARTIFLVGFMGAGKSSVGLALSRKLGWPFEDLDQRIEAQERRSIEQIFQQSGEAAFRQIEGAGFPVIFLDAPVEELFRRCQEQQLNRPLRRDLEEFRRLYEMRRPCYLRAALRIETNGKDVEGIAAEVIESLRNDAV